MGLYRLWTFTLTLLTFLFNSTTTTTIRVNDGVCLYRKWERPGDVKFLVIAGIRGNNQNGVCGAVSTDIFEEIAAMEWITSLLAGNGSHSFIPGVTIGYDIYDNCDDEDLTTDLLYSGLMSGQDMNCTIVPPESSIYIGAISLTTPRVTNVISRMLDPLPVFRPLASSPVLNNNVQKNLLQSVASFQLEATAIAQMLARNNMNFIVVIYTTEAVDEAEVFIELARAYRICIILKGNPVSSTVSKIFNIMNQAYNKSIAVVYFGNKVGAKNVIRLSNKERPFGSKIHWVFTSKLAHDVSIEGTLSAADSIVSVNLHEDEHHDFIDFFFNLILYQTSSPLQGLMNKFNISRIFDPVTGSSIYPYRMVDAVVTLAYSVRNIWKTECQGHSSPGNCPAFQEIEAKMLKKVKLRVTTSENDEKYLPAFYSKTLLYQPDGTLAFDSLRLKLYTSLQVLTIGEFKDDQYIPATVALELPTSACRLTCPECQEQNDLKYSYLHGDYLILGLFSLRMANTDSPFKCGQIRRSTNDIITVSAFLQSVILRRNETGIKFGAIAIDDCYNGLNASYYLAELFSKRKLIKDPANPSRIINFDNVISIVGALSSSVTLVVADLSNSIKLPLISYSASSPDLDNRNRYPYFLRTVPSDTLQVQGMISLVLKLGVSHVGLVYINDAYGQGGKLRLEREAASRNICVETPISVTQNMDSDYVEKSVIRKLKHQQVRVVLLFAIDSVAQNILDVINSKFGFEKKPFVFISSEGWGHNRRLLSTASLGSLVFNIAAKNYSTEHYRLYLQNLQPFMEDENRWLPRYFEDYNQCDFLGSFEKTFSSKSGEPIICTKDFKNVLDADTTKSLVQDQRYIHTMLSVYAVTDGFQKFCRNKGPCSPGDVKAKLNGNLDSFFEYIRKSRFAENGDTPIFDEDGNGYIGFTIYNIQRDEIRHEYKMVGTYQNDGKLQLSRQLKFYNDLGQEVTLEEVYAEEINCFNYIATCSRVCPMVDTTTATPTSSTESFEEPDDDKNSSLMTLTIVFGIFMAVLFVALVFVVVILVRIQSRQIKQLSERGESSGQTGTESDVHSVYDEPGSIKRKNHFDNLSFMPDTTSLQSHSLMHDMRVCGSTSGLNMQQPIQYAHVRQMSNPDIHIHHVRQISNQELHTPWFDSLERPNSTMSAPAYKPHHHQRSPVTNRMMNVPGTKHKPYKHSYSPKTPHSAPTGTKQHVVYRPRAHSSPRFRYPSTISSDESHYTLPKLDNDGYEDMAPKRKMGVSDDNVHDHLETVHDLTDNNCGNAESYLYPSQSGTNESHVASEPEHKITYLTAKDLITSESEDEEETLPEEEESYIKYSGVESQRDVSIEEASLKNPKKSDVLTNITSPTDNEVMNINFPPKEKTFSPISSNTQCDTKQSNTKPNLNGENESAIKFVEERDERQQKSEPVILYQKEKSRNSLSDVPDIIKHGVYEEDGVFII